MLFSTDFLLSLIIVTIILGFSAGLIDAEESRLAESFREDHVKKRAADGVEVLINSPGDPPGWENLPAAMCRSSCCSRTSGGYLLPEVHETQLKP